jgi:hypothetical protein
VTTEERIEVQDIDHLGIIAGIIDDMGIVEIRLYRTCYAELIVCNKEEGT